MKRSKRAIEWDYPEYSQQLLDRLKAGAKQYGDVSYERAAGDLVEEIQQELLDVSGWAFILWTRLEELKRKVGTL